jgi:hypothetical protein
VCEASLVIFGAHVVVYSRDSDADRTFLRDVLSLASIDAGDGWLIFALPPAELAVHPADSATAELYLMCDDLDIEMANLAVKGVAFSTVEEPRWGSVTKIGLPGGGTLGLYQPRHRSPLIAE